MLYAVIKQEGCDLYSYEIHVHNEPRRIILPMIKENKKTLDISMSSNKTRITGYDEYSNFTLHRTLVIYLTQSDEKMSDTIIKPDDVKKILHIGMKTNAGLTKMIFNTFNNIIIK
jgi:hypothetical protein